MGTIAWDDLGVDKSSDEVGIQWRRSVVKSRGVRVSRVKPSNWGCQKRMSEVNDSDQ